MKAFAIKKINIDKCAKLQQSRVNKLNIQFSIFDGVEFSFIEISNPLKSYCIYEVNNISLKLKNNNKLRLSIGESILKNYIDKELETNILCEQTEDNSMEILTSIIAKGESISILDNYSIILLPGGSIFLKTIKPIDEMILDMECTQELL